MPIPKILLVASTSIFFLAPLSACNKVQDIDIQDEYMMEQDADVAETAVNISPLMVGMSAPAFSLTAADGTVFSFDPEEVNRPLVLTFYRGGFCPYCNRQLAELRHVEARLVELGYDVAFVSMDRSAILKSNLKFENVSYTLLSDSKALLTKAFGLAYYVSDETIARYLQNGIDLEKDSGETHHILPVPATYIIGKDAVIDFAYVNPNYRERVHPDLVLKAAELALE